MRIVVSALLAAVALVPPSTAMGQSTYEYQTISPGNSYPYSTIGRGHSYSYSTIRPGDTYPYSTLTPTFRNLDEQARWYGYGGYAGRGGINGVGHPPLSAQAQVPQARPQLRQRTMTAEEAAAYLIGRVLEEALSRR